jgi:peptidoglycan/xylan/chitin deacetylase (PgdA/CDA1 family)
VAFIDLLKALSPIDWARSSASTAAKSGWYEACVKLSADELAHRAGGSLPQFALKPMLGAGLAGQGCALCLHRMAPEQRSTDWQPGLNMPPAELDTLIDLLLSSRPGRSDGWLTVTFDDGYADSAEYLRTRATRFPQVEFLFFVCPEKLEHRAGFRWDLAEEAMKRGTPRSEAVALVDAPVDLATENSRADLEALGRLPDYQLSTVEEARALTTFPNITLGNHTNLHLSAVKLADEVVRGDYQRSTQAFSRLFGAQTHFAFPYGTPQHHFAPRHVEMLRALGDFAIWTTEARPYPLHERGPRAVLPRFPVNGERSAHELAGWIAARSLDFRVRGRRRA